MKIERISAALVVAIMGCNVVVYPPDDDDGGDDMVVPGEISSGDESSGEGATSTAQPGSTDTSSGSSPFDSSDSTESGETDVTCESDPLTGECLCDGEVSEPWRCECEVEPVSAVPEWGICTCQGGGPSHPAFCGCSMTEKGECVCFGGSSWSIATCECIDGIPYPPDGPAC